MDNPEVQRTAVRETERQLQTQSMKARDVQIVRRCDAAFDFQVCRHGLAFVGKVLIDGQMIVHAPEAPALGEQISIAHRLVD
jgi:RNase P/RNase MRP subunit p29